MRCSGREAIRWAGGLDCRTTRTRPKIRRNRVEMSTVRVIAAERWSEIITCFSGNRFSLVWSGSWGQTGKTEAQELKANTTPALLKRGGCIHAPAWLALRGSNWSLAEGILIKWIEKREKYTNYVWSSGPWVINKILAGQEALHHTAPDAQDASAQVHIPHGSAIIVSYWR